MKQFPTKIILGLTGCVCCLAAVIALFFFCFGTDHRIACYASFNAAAILAAVCFRAVSDRSFGTACMVIFGVAMFAFVLSAILTGPQKHPPGRFGDGSWANLISAITFPLRFLPLVIPALPCWIASLATEKWPVAWHIAFGLITIVVAWLNLMLIFNVALNPKLYELLLG